MKITILRAMIALFVVAMGISSCRYNSANDSEPFYQAVYRPIYVSAEEARKVKIMPAQNLKSPGKIYYKDRLLYIGESDKGVHIIDNSDPKNPHNLHFLSIPGCRDVAIKGNILYAANMGDLIAIDISAPENAKVLSRTENVFPVFNYPDFTGVRFECPDASKGIVVGWERITDEKNAECYR
jgi:hypothetical protein